MNFGFGFGGLGAMMPTKFEEQYHCYSVAYADKSHLEVSKQVVRMPLFVRFLPYRPSLTIHPSPFTE
jgi:hypothetical protein